jgi:hypothetical protein
MAQLELVRKKTSAVVQGWGQAQDASDERTNLA